MILGMASLVRHLTFDCADPWALATFWTGITGGSLGEGDEPGDDEVEVVWDGGVNLLFIRVPEGKSAKNRLHLDLQPHDRTRDEEVERAVAFGATVLDDRRNADGTGWVVLADPEGNEFCVVRSTAERVSHP